MRNQLTTRASSIPDVVYSATGKLDGCDVDLLAWSKDSISISSGPCRLSLTPVAMIELITHLHKAMNGVVDYDEKEEQ